MYDDVYCENFKWNTFHADKNAQTSKKKAGKCNFVCEP